MDNNTVDIFVKKVDELKWAVIDIKTGEVIAECTSSTWAQKIMTLIRKDLKGDQGAFSY